jgi:hypothetical protein
MNHRDNGLCDRVHKTILVKILRKAFKSVGAEAFGGLDEVSEGSSEGTCWLLGVDEGLQAKLRSS